MKKCDKRSQLNAWLEASNLFCLIINYCNRTQISWMKVISSIQSHHTIPNDDFPRLFKKTLVMVKVNVCGKFSHHNIHSDPSIKSDSIAILLLVQRLNFLLFTDLSLSSVFYIFVTLCKAPIFPDYNTGKEHFLKLL